MELIIDNPLPLTDPVIETFRIDSERNAYRIVEEMPKLKGGIWRLQNRIKYPRKAIRDEVQGRVIIQFVVDERGQVQDPVVLKSIRKIATTKRWKRFQNPDLYPENNEASPSV